MTKLRWQVADDANLHMRIYDVIERKSGRVVGQMGRLSATCWCVGPHVKPDIVSAARLVYRQQKDGVSDV